jgi:hypothetical protein
MSLPPWIRESTTPDPEEVAGVSTPVDPAVLGAVRAATAPTASEVARLRARPPRRGWSPLWLGAPVVLALTLLTARWTLPQLAIDGAPDGADGAWVMAADVPLEVLPGVWVEGRGAARVADGRLRLDGILRVDARAPVTFEVGAARFSTDGAELHVAGDGLAVVRGTVRAPDGRFLVAGDRWTPGVVAAAPEAVPTELPTVVAPRRVPVRPPPAPAAAPEPAAPPAPVPPSSDPAPAPPVPVAVADWRAILDAREAGLSGAALVARLDGHLGAHPTSPFAGEAADWAALERASSEPAPRALAALEGRLASGSATRVLELHAAAAFVAREGLRDCGRAAPHDGWVAEHGTERQRATARAFLGLCALRDGRTADAARWLEGVDERALDAELRAAVGRARSAGTGGEAP